MSYEFFQASGSRFRVVLGSDLYDEHWNNFLNHISSSEDIPSESNSKLESWLVECETNNIWDGHWFYEYITANSGSFK